MGIAIVGSGSYLPDTILTNTQIVERLDVDEQWIVDKTGIKERRIAAPGEANSDMGTYAARRALEDAGLEASDVDLIVLASTNPDQPMPATACFVQSKLGASHAVAFDVSAACSGFVFALATAHDMLTANSKRSTALVIGAETFSRFIDYQDRKTAALFGDGAGAIVLRRVDDADGILATALDSDGTLTELAHIPAGGTRIPASQETIIAGKHYIKMRGGGVRETVRTILPKITHQALEQTDLKITDIDLIVPHQMNGVMLREWPDIINVPPEIIYQTVSWSGNTGAASIPIALDDATKNGAISGGDHVLLIAFGGGLTWGSTILRWN